MDPDFGARMAGRIDNKFQGVPRNGAARGTP